MCSNSTCMQLSWKKAEILAHCLINPLPHNVTFEDPEKEAF